jgi:membrane protein
MRNLSNIPKILYKTVVSFVSNEGIELSGYIAYNILLSLFPFMIFLAALTRLLDHSGNLLNATSLLYRFAPDELLKIMQPIIDDVLKTNQDGGIVTLGIITAVWASSTGIEALRVGLNRAYQLGEHRSLIHRRLQSVAMVVLASLTMMVLSLAIVIGPLLIELAKRVVTLGNAYDLAWNVTRYLLAFVTVVASLAVFYRYLPDHKTYPDYRSSLPGALFATVLWLLLATAFSVYLTSRGSNYSLTYGSLAGAIILILFFHLSAMIVFLGGELNAMLMKDAHGIVQHTA